MSPKTTKAPVRGLLADFTVGAFRASFDGRASKRLGQYQNPYSGASKRTKSVRNPLPLILALSTPVQARGKLASLISCRLRVECPRRRNERAGVKARAGSVQHPGSLTSETGFRGRFAQAFTIQHHLVKAGNSNA